MPSKNTTRTVNAASLLSLAEVAHRWRCRYNAVRRRLRRAGVPVIALGPGTLRVRLTEILKAEQAHA
jgi:hypothetical protein